MLLFICNFKIYGIDSESKQGNEIFPSKRRGVWETAMKVCYMHDLDLHDMCCTLVHAFP